MLHSKSKRENRAEIPSLRRDGQVLYTEELLRLEACLGWAASRRKRWRRDVAAIEGCEFIIIRRRLR